MCGRNRRDSRKATVNIFSGNVKDGNKTSNTVTGLFILYAEINPRLERTLNTQEIQQLIKNLEWPLPLTTWQTLLCTNNQEKETPTYKNTQENTGIAHSTRRAEMASYDVKKILHLIYSP